MPDKDEPGPTAGENDLKALTVSIDPALTGTVTLSAIAGATRIKLYENADRSNPVTLPKSWTVPTTDLPETLYVEGFSVSLAARDIELKVLFTGSGGPCEDRVKLTVVKIKLTELTFSGDKFHPVSKDDGTGVYGTAHWKDNSVPPDYDADDVGDHKFPVSFTRSTFMKISARLAVEPASAFGTGTLVVGQALSEPSSQSFSFEGTATLMGTELVITDVPADVPLASNVDFMEPLRINWRVSPDGGATMLDCATDSTHRVYVTLGDPNPGPLYETVVHLGCSNAAGFSDEAVVIALIWSDFTDRAVFRKPLDGFNNPDGHQLTYYQNWNCVNTTTASLLANGDGQCGSWAKLFIDILGGQGINHTDEWVFLFNRDATDSSLGFVVNNWSFASGGGVSGHAVYPYLNLDGSPLITGPPYAYNWLFSEVTDGIGVPGQGTADPASLFNNHQVVKFGTPPVYYDPSYGVTYSSLADIDNLAIDGYLQRILGFPVDEPVVGLDLNGDGDMIDLGVPTPVFVLQSNPTGNQLVEVFYEYP